MSSHRPEGKRIDHGIVLRPLMVFFSSVILLGIHSAIFACLPQGTERKIVSDDFTKNRQEAAPSNSDSKSQGQSSNSVPPPRPRRTYRLASQPTVKTRPSATGSVIAQLGIT